jgi:hypothetical protein
MPLASIQLATISPSNKAEGKYIVTVHSDDGQQMADFDCDSEHDAIVLRNAIRQRAARLRHVVDYRPRPNRTAAVALGLPESQALALAQFVKRVGWSEMRSCAVDDAEAYVIRDAIDTLRNRLADAGFAPR